MEYMKNLLLPLFHGSDEAMPIWLDPIFIVLLTLFFNYGDILNFPASFKTRAGERFRLSIPIQT